MTRAKLGEWLLLAAVAIAAAAAGYAYNVWRTSPSAPEASAVEGPQSLAAARFADLEGKPQALDQWRGKVMVVNFWATWCAPCREEIPLFVRLQKQYGERGLQFVGIAIDQVDKVRPYAAELGMNFPVLIGGIEGIELGRKLGNRAGVLPFTLVIDRDGRIVASEVGVVKPAKLEPLLKSLL